MSSDERRLTRDDKENTGLKKKKRKIGDMDVEDENAEKQRKTARIDQTSKPFKIYVEPQKNKVAATGKSCDTPRDLVEKSSQTEATGDCTCSCHETPAPSSHNPEPPGGEKEKPEGSSSKPLRDEEDGEGSCAEPPGGEDSKPEETQKTPEEEAYDLMVNEEIPEEYWKDLAEERRKALDESLVENEQLHHKVKDLEEENSKLKEMASQAEYFASILKKLTQDEEESDNNSTDNHDDDGTADVNASTASEAEDSDSNDENRGDDVTASEAE